MPRKTTQITGWGVILNEDPPPTEQEMDDWLLDYAKILVPVIQKNPITS